MQTLLNLLANKFPSKLLIDLFEDFAFTIGSLETTYMTLISVVFAYVIGLPIGIILSITDENGLTPIKPLNIVLGFIVNVLRSIPFLILMLAMMPVAKFILNKSTGNAAMILMLVIASAPYVARMVESSIKEIDKGVIEAAKSMGANTFEIIFKVLIPEAKPSLIVGAVISTVTVFGYTAMSATIGGTGLGAIAITEGYSSFDMGVIWTCVLFMVIIVQFIQIIGMFIAKKTDRRITSRKRKKENI